jgi:acetyl-CoA carboxylase beta subunit
MASIEQTVKGRFARVFQQSDWHLFKGMADRYFERSAFL